MSRFALYRNAKARDLLDVFLVSAVSTVLTVRFYLHITGYPQIGGGSLHIAHMLWGGLLMMAALVITLTFLGNRARQLAALVGGIGFGLFIDELGKFITKDNNYFFQPTIGLIYAIFVALYLGFNFLTRAQRLTSREYQLNALDELEEAVAQDMDRAEKARLHAFLDASDQDSVITKELRMLVNKLEVTAAQRPSRWHRLTTAIDLEYQKFWRLRTSHTLISLLFIAEIFILVAGSLYAIYTSVDDLETLFSGTPTYGEELLIGQVSASIIAAGLVVYGLTQLRTSRLEAFEHFRRAALINVYLTQFFVFVRLQFDAIPGFILNLAVLLLISFVLSQEARLGKRYARRQR